MVRCRGSAKEDIKFESCDSMLHDRHPKDRRFMYAPSFDRVSNHAEISKSPAIHRLEPATMLGVSRCGFLIIQLALDRQ